MERRTFLQSASSWSLGAALAPLFGIRSARASSQSNDLTSSLEESDLIYVSTRRKSGDWSSQAPIWFWFNDGTVYFTCSPDSWKAKRLKEAGPIRIHVGDEDGPEIVGEATRIHDLDLIDRLGEAWGEKYFIAWLGLFKPRRERIADGRTFAYQVKVD